MRSNGYGRSAVQPLPRSHTLVGHSSWQAGNVATHGQDFCAFRSDKAFEEWLSGEPSETIPMHMSCTDLIFVTAVRSGALSSARAEKIHQLGLEAASLASRRSVDRRELRLPPPMDVAGQARAAFLFDVLGFSGAKPYMPGQGEGLEAGDIVFFGRPGDHVAVATGEGEEVISIWKGRFGQAGSIERTTITALVEQFCKELEEPTEAQIARVPFKHRLVEHHLVDRWREKNVQPHIRVASSPWSKEADTPAGSWSATARILGEEATAKLVSRLGAPPSNDPTGV